MTTTSKQTSEDKKKEEERQWLEQPGNLDRRLDQLDRERPIQRIYVMGCGRSGTWLLTAVMSTFEDVAVLPHEVAIEQFGFLETSKPTLVLKRDWKAYARIPQIPARISILYIIRHPYDVLTSHNPMTQNRFHIQTIRWLGEMAALRQIHENRTQSTKIIRYEDLVMQPESCQMDIGAFFGLKVSSQASEFTATFNAPPNAVKAMHGLRTIDRKSVERYKRDPEQIDHIRMIRTELEEHLGWVADNYGYDISL